MKKEPYFLLMKPFNINSERVVWHVKTMKPIWPVVTVRMNPARAKAIAATALPITGT